MESQRFNTMVSGLMEFVNLLYEKYNNDSWYTRTYHQALDTFLLLIAPAAPFISEELWQQTGHHGSVHLGHWPQWNPEIAFEQRVQIPIQVNGKKRDLIEVDSGATKSEVESAALASPKVQAQIAGRKLQEVIYVPGKILNIRI
jgi:leucyl-tRNA synthetase